MLSRIKGWGARYRGSWSTLVAAPWLAAMLGLAALSAGSAAHAPRDAFDAAAAMVPLSAARVGGAWPDEARAMAELSRPSVVDKVVQTGLSEDSFVFGGAIAKPGVLFFTSRHVVALECWVKGAAGPARRAGAGYGGEFGGIERFAQGYALKAGPSDRSFACAQQSTGPAKISALALTPEQAASVQGAHEWSKGSLVSGIGILVLFMLLAGWVNRDWRYALFGLSLVVGMRVAQISQGSDASFLGMALAQDWMPRIRMVTIALHVGLQLLIFKVLIEKEESMHPRRWVAAWNEWTMRGVEVMFAMALTFPFRWYLPAMWAIVLNAICSLGCRVALLLGNKRTRSETVVWCAMGLGITLLSWVSEVVSAAVGMGEAVKWLNNETAVLLSALMFSMAFAQQLKDERREKVKAQDQLRLAYDSSPMGLFEADLDGAIMQVNPALRSMLGESSRGLSLAAHLQPGAWDDLVELAVGSSTPVDATTRALDENGRERWLDIRARVNAQGRVEGSVQEATERVIHKKRLEFLASHDPLTECLNLRGLEIELDAIDCRQGGDALVAYFDLDRFKLINDVYGHEAGDAVLREVKVRMQRALGSHAALGRVGGDEFLALFQGIDMDDAQRRCERVLLDLSSEPFVHEGKSFKLSVSAGLVEPAAVGADTARALIGAADSACRMAKSQGRAQLVAYGRGSMFFERRMEAYEIAKLFEGDQVPDGLYLLGQPIMSLSAPFDSLNFEILLRMKFPDGRLVGAGPLVETAEAHGHIAKLDYWVLSTVLDWIRDHRKELAQTRFICVNLSGGSLNDETFLDKAFALLESRRAEAAYLCVEITESVALRDLDNIRAFVERARALGARVALDDFGAGYSSFGYLKDLPADALKIDGALARDAMENPASQSILVALSGLSTALGMRSIGEWAENCEMVKMLALSSFDYAQGYAVAKPMPLDDLIKARSCGDLIEDPATAIYARLLQSGGGMEFSFEQEPRYLH